MRARKIHDDNSRKVHKDTKNPMRRTNAKPCPHETSCICSNVLQSFQDLADVVTAIKTNRGVEVMTNPASGDVMARDEPKCAKRSSMIGAFVTQIPTVIIYVLHGEP